MIRPRISGRCPAPTVAQASLPFTRHISAHQWHVRDAKQFERVRACYNIVSACLLVAYDSKQRMHHSWTSGMRETKGHILARSGEL